MKTGIKVALVFVLGFLSGGASGYFFCKSRETKFEVVTDEDQAESAGLIPEPAKETAEEKIDKTFAENNVAEPATESQIMKNINTQKTKYWEKFQNDGGKYDRHSELPEGEDPTYVDDSEIDPDFIEAAEETEEEQNEIIENLPDIEQSNLSEFYHWNGIPDGEYDTISVRWYQGDNVLTDEDDQEIRDAVKYLGFDPKEMFEGKRGVDEDPDAIYIKNNHFKTVYEVIRYKATFSVQKRMEEFGGDE